jgi:hypothetical protein
VSRAVSQAAAHHDSERVGLHGYPGGAKVGTEGGAQGDGIEEPRHRQADLQHTQRSAVSEKSVPLDGVGVRVQCVTRANVEDIGSDRIKSRQVKSSKATYEDVEDVGADRGGDGHVSVAAARDGDRGQAVGDGSAGSEYEDAHDGRLDAVPEGRAHEEV